MLLGDPQQLAQVSQGSHPDGAERSALEHVLGDHDTMPPDLGLFLATTYRMHPTVCAFISETSTRTSSRPQPGLEHQVVDVEGLLAGGPAVRARGARTQRDLFTRGSRGRRSSPRGLVGGTWTDETKKKRKLVTDDVLVVAPYNAQVAELHRHLPAGARVGTVDKFQGQEAPVTIYSMATSTADDAPRGMEFLYDLHRLNVAVSRARSISVVVCSPELLRVLCRTPSQMRLANALCRYAEVAKGA